MCKRVLASFAILTLWFFAWLPGPLSAGGLLEGSHGHKLGKTIQPPSYAKVKLLDVELLDQEGRTVRFKSDVISDHLVIMNFIYTSCTTQCPLNSQVMAQVQQDLPENQRDLVRLVSLSIDPNTDTPERLKEYASRFKTGPNWAWLTGSKPQVDKVLTALGVYTPDFDSHPSVVLVGDAQKGRWARINGLTTADQLLATIKHFVKERSSVNAHNHSAGQKPARRKQDPKQVDAKARNYFTDLPVVTHEGKSVKFYTDLLKDKVVLISLFFSSCKESCPITLSKLSHMQPMLEGDLGKNVFFISITLDPENDTQEKLKTYVENFQPQPGWIFVTGSPENIKTITRRLGQVGEDINAHSPMIMVGDVKHARWRKFFPNVPNEELVKFLRYLVSDSRS